MAMQKAKGQKQRRINHDYSRFWKHEITLKLQAGPVYPQTEIRGDSSHNKHLRSPFILSVPLSPHLSVHRFISNHSTLRTFSISAHQLTRPRKVVATFCKTVHTVQGVSTGN